MAVLSHVNSWVVAESPGSRWDVWIAGHHRGEQSEGSLQLGHHGPMARPAIFSLRLAHSVGDKVQSGDLVGKGFWEWGVSLDWGTSPSLSHACTPWHLFAGLWQVFTGVAEHLGLLPLHKFSPSSLVPTETPGTSSDWAPWGLVALSGSSQAGALLLASGGHLAAWHLLNCFQCSKFLSSCLFSHFYFKSFTFLKTFQVSLFVFWQEMMIKTRLRYCGLLKSCF